MQNGNLAPAPGAMILLSGLPGSGKTTFAMSLARQLAFEHIESDAIRRSLATMPSYSPGESGAVFARVESLARVAIAAGKHVLVDATNLTARDRKRFVQAASELGARIIAIRITAPEEVIRERLRNPRVGFSQAGVEIFERMKDRPQPFPFPCIVVDSRFDLTPALDLTCSLVNDHQQ